MMHIVITGSTRGIGYGLATQFLKRGIKVTINGTTDQSVKQAIIKLKEEFPNGEIFGSVGNTFSYSDVLNLYHEAVKHFGPIDTWINNAGIDQNRQLFFDLNYENYQKVVNINILGVLNGSHVALKQFLEQGYGQIYNMEGFGSDGMIMDKMSIYGTTKRAIRYFSRALSKEARNTPINVGRISPGMVVTDILKNALEEDNEESRQARKIFNILADKVETVTNFIADEILKNNHNGHHIKWLTKRKAMFRFISAPITKRNVLE